MLEYIEKHQEETQRLLGIKYNQFKKLLEAAIKLHNEKQEREEAKTKRLVKKGSSSWENEIGFFLVLPVDNYSLPWNKKNPISFSLYSSLGGRKPKLSKEQQIILTLTYLRHFTTFQLLGIQFGVIETTANDIFNYWWKILRELLPESLLEEVKKNSEEYEIVHELLTEYELIVDSYEQPIERPGEYEEQKKYSEGKKKKHTKKSQLIVFPGGKDIVDIEAGEPGKKSDINYEAGNQRKICSRTKIRPLAKIFLWYNKGF